MFLTVGLVDRRMSSDGLLVLVSANRFLLPRVISKRSQVSGRTGMFLCMTRPLSFIVLDLEILRGVGNMFPFNDGGYKGCEEDLWRKSSWTANSRAVHEALASLLSVEVGSETMLDMKATSSSICGEVVITTGMLCLMLGVPEGEACEIERSWAE